MQCRIGCGACCIVPSINSPIPGMPEGKPVGVRCVQLSSDNRCLLFGDPRRPQFCQRLQPSWDMCGNKNAEAFKLLEDLERATSPAPVPSG